MGYELSDDPLSAGGFGPADASIRVRPGPVRTVLIQSRNPYNDMWSMPEVPKGQSWNAKFALLLLYNFYFITAVARTVESWRRCARNIGTAYVRAAKRHRYALNKADKSTTALTFAAMWSAVSVLATGGASFCFGSDLKTTAASVLMDMTTTLTGAIGDAGPAFSAYFQDPPDGENIEPQEYQNQLGNWIGTVEEGVRSALRAHDNALLRLTSVEQNLYDVNRRRLDLAEALDRLTPLQGMPTLSAESIEQMATTLEKHFWAEWILKQCSQKSGYMSVPGAVADRLDELDVLKGARTTNGFWHTLGSVPVISSILSRELGHTSVQDRKLLVWASKFKASFDKSAWSKLAA